MDQAANLRNIVKEYLEPKKSIARVITVTSGKGGVGKSNLSVNLAIQLSRLGKRVIVLDADFGLANVEVMLGIRPRYTLADMIFGGKNLSEIITMGPDNIGFLSGGSGIQELNHLTKDQIKLLTDKLAQLDEFADVIIIDTGAGIGDAVMEFILCSSEVLLVATPEPTSITDAYALVKALNRKEEFTTENTSLRLVANRVQSEAEGRDLYNKFNEVILRFLNIKLDYLGSVIQDMNVQKSVMQQKPVSVVYPHSSASNSYKKLAEILTNTRIQEEKKIGLAKLFSKMIRNRNCR